MNLNKKQVSALTDTAYIDVYETQQQRLSIIKEKLVNEKIKELEQNETLQILSKILPIEGAYVTLDGNFMKSIGSSNGYPYGFKSIADVAEYVIDSKKVKKEYVNIHGEEITKQDIEREIHIASIGSTGVEEIISNVKIKLSEIIG